MPLPFCSAPGQASIVRRIEFIEEEAKDLKEYEDLDFKTYSMDKNKRRGKRL